MKKAKKPMKRLIVLLIVCAMILPALYGCTSKNTSSDTDTPSDSSFASEDTDATWDDSATVITLSDNDSSIDGSGASVKDNTITISSAGTYVISGSLTDGQIIVDATDNDLVRIVLNGVDIACSDSSPIYVDDALKVVLILAEGTENTVSDASSYDTDEDGEPDATIFSKADLSITGRGTLNVNANYNNGIKSKDDLKITEGTINVVSVDDGIIGKDMVAIENATVTINAGGDGIKATNDTDSALGYVRIDSGTLNITAVNDGIQGVSAVMINGGVLNISSGVGSANSINNSSSSLYNPGSSMSSSSSEEESSSGKGIKSSSAITISGGSITVDSADDAVHSNDAVTVSGGELTLNSGDDGMHADTSLIISGGSITITKSYEGLESATITINDGTIYITSSDDGINCAGGADSSSTSGRAGQANMNAVENAYLYINGGYVYINASGDGLDSNGSIEMTGGTVLVCGPTANDNGAIDYNGTFTMTGGLLVAAGSSGMVEAPESSSTQYVVSTTFSSSIAANTRFTVTDSSGNLILSFVPTKSYQNVVVCSPDLAKGSTYLVYTGGSCFDASKDGLTTSGTYTAGTQYASFTISSIVTSAGSSGGNTQIRR